MGFTRQSKKPIHEDQTAPSNFQEEARALLHEKARLVAYLEEHDGQPPPRDEFGDNERKLDHLLRLARGPFDARYEKVDNGVLRRQMEDLRAQIRRLVLMVMGAPLPSPRAQEPKPVHQRAVWNDMDLANLRWGGQEPAVDETLAARSDMHGDNDVEMMDLGSDEFEPAAESDGADSEYMPTRQERQSSKRKREEGAEDEQNLESRTRSRKSGRSLYARPWKLRSNGL
jgi:hypothetical protein